MSVQILTYQIAPISANAGNQSTSTNSLSESVTVNSPSSLTFGSGPSSPNSTGPGWATPTGGSTAPDGTQAGSVPFTQSAWATYLIILALAYFAWKELR